MTLILSGTDGLSDVDGSAATPAIRGTDVNTGIFFGTDIIGFSEGGVEAMRIDASGNVGIGTSSPTVKLEAVAGTGSQSIGLFRTGDATAANNAGGGFNAASSATAGSRNARIWLDADGANFAGSDYFYIDKVGNSGDVNLIQQSNAAMTFQTNGTERARITSSGNLLVGVTSTGGGGGSIVSRSGDGAQVFQMQHTGSSDPYGTFINYLNSTPNGSGNNFIQCNDSTTLRMSVRSNGGIANYSANDANLSDRREKTNFAPAKSYLDVICAIPVQTFNYIDQNMEEDGGLTLGVVAQDVQAIAPELVTESNWGTKEEPKMRLSIYQTDLQYALMKCIQELKAEFDAYKEAHP